MSNKGHKPAPQPDPPPPVDPDPAPQPEASQEATTTAEGKRTRRAVMLKQFVPSPDWINKNIVAGGKGTRKTLGRIFGVATGSEMRNATLPSGEVTQNIAITGLFNTESYVTGELGEGTVAFFPRAYAEKIHATFQSDPNIKVIELDCDVGLEATGKTIPYEWVIVAYLAGEEMAVLKRLRQSRGRPKDAPALPAPAAQKQLTGPSA